MARTNTVTEPTFMVFGNRLNEHAAYVENRFPATTDPATVTLSPETPPEIYADWQRRHNDQKAYAEVIAARELEEAGIDWSDEKIRTLIAKMGEWLLSGMYTPPRFKPVALAYLGDDDYKFNRNIVVETIIGTLVALGDGSPNATVRILNYGMPNGLERAAGVKADEVQGAKRTFVQMTARIIRDPRLSIKNKIGLIEGIAWHFGVKARAAGMLWREMGGTTDRRGDRPYDELTSAMRDGSIFERHAQMLNRAAEWELPLARRREILGWIKNHLLKPKRSTEGGTVKSTRNRHLEKPRPTIAT